MHEDKYHTVKVSRIGITNLLPASKLGDLDVDPAVFKKLVDDSLLRYCEAMLGGPCPQLCGMNVSHTCGDNQLCINDDSRPSGYVCKHIHIKIQTDQCRYSNAYLDCRICATFYSLLNSDGLM